MDLNQYGTSVSVGPYVPHNFYFCGLDQSLFFLRSQRLSRLKSNVHKGPCFRFLSNGGLGISVVEASRSVTGHLVRGILGKSDV